MITPAIRSNGDAIAGGWLHLIGVVLFSFSLILLLFYLAHLSVVHESRLRSPVPSLVSSDPQQTARQAIRAGDLRYLAVPAHRTATDAVNDRLSIPGVGDFDVNEAADLHYRCIPGVNAHRWNEVEESEYRQVLSYAQAYNQVLSEERARRGL